ncbi:MAG: nucleoside recognition domain-containing protein [Tissierellia bacterium]|nr:nucleoside recognition domain-containing protein [Tissierellia bacterium]
MNGESIQEQVNIKHDFNRNLFLFIICSAIGVFSFFVPMEGKTLFEIMYKALIIAPLGDKVRYVVLMMTVFNVFGFIYARLMRDKGVDNYVVQRFKKDSLLMGLTYVLAFIFVVMALTQKGLWFIYSDKTVGYMIVEIFPFTIGCLTIGGLILPLLTQYGILEFIGVQLEPIMRPILKLPGKAAIDSIASVVGAAVVGIYLTTSLYHDNQYTEKEALSIASGFSLNSVGYCAFLVGYVGLIEMFNVMFITYLIIAYIMAAIIVRIPPISWHKDVYKDGTVQTEEMRREGSEKFSIKTIRKGFVRAIEKADKSENVFKELFIGGIEGFMVVVGIIPMMVVIGGICLAVYNYTPIIRYMSMPLIPIIQLFKIPEAAIAAESIFLGGLELFMPSLTVTASTTNMAVRYFVVMVSMLQVLYITETMLPIKSFGLPVKLSELIIIWAERTLISIPMVALMTHIMFG